MRCVFLQFDAIVMLDIVLCCSSVTFSIDEYQLTLLILIEMVIWLYRRRPNLTIGGYIIIVLCKLFSRENEE